jgi:zinc transporter ZupT
MESLSFFDLVWRVVLASAFALTPGILFWMLVLGLLTAARRLGRGRRASASASEAARP